MSETERSRGTAGWQDGLLEPGAVLDRRYRLTGRLGRGGFGDVWAADELLPDGTVLREVALKLLDPRLLDGGTEGRGSGGAAGWGVEAKILASLRHASLVTIYAAGTLELGGEARLPFVAMERLEGRTLGELLAEAGPVAWRRALRWAREIAAALDVIHRSRIVHLDLKPANLFLTREGSIKVLDFGIARRRDREEGGGVRVQVVTRGAASGFGETVPIDAADPRGLDATAPFAPSRSITLVGGSGDLVMGTPGFVAPEVLRGEEPSPAADAYGLASVVVQLVTGDLPQAVSRELDTETPAGLAAWWAEMRDATLEGKLRDLAAARMPRALAALLTRLLAPRPDARGVQAGALAALFELVWHHPHGVPPAPYPGLVRPDADWEGALFGRHDEIQRLVRELEVTPLVVLHGERGAGKRSLALAGVVPELARVGALGRDAWTARVVGRGEDLAEALGGDPSALLEAPAVGEGTALVIEGLAERLAGEPAARDLLERVLRGEELVGARVLWLAREEELGALDADRLAALRPWLRFLGPVAPAAARDLVVGPLELRGASTDGVDPIVASVRRELAAGTPLSLVSFALAEAWRAAGGSEGLRRPGSGDAAGGSEGLRRPGSGDAAGDAGLAAGWRRSGGVPGAVAAVLRAALGGLAPEPRATAERVLLLLGGESARRSPFSEAELLAWVHAADAPLAALERAGLVRTAPSRELALGHPSLAAATGPLADAKLARAAEIAAFDALRDAALAWERSERSPELLLRRTELEGALRAMPALPAPLAELVRASRAKLRNEGLRRAGTALALAGLVSGALWLKAASDERARTEQAARVEADARARLADVLSRVHRAEDGWMRAAWIGAALEQGSTDPTHVLDLVGALANAPYARFLTLAPAHGPVAFGGGRWIVAEGPGARLTWADLEPEVAELSAVDGLSIDSNLEDLRRWVAPVVRELDLGEQPAQLVPIPFDRSVAVVSLSGSVTVLRSRAGPRTPSGVDVAARADLGCRGPLVVAERAPVFACSAGDRVALWDLRRSMDPDAGISHAREPGLPLDLAPDGRNLALADGKRLALVPVEDGYAFDTVALDLPWQPALARFSPSGQSVAVATAVGVDVLDARDGKVLHKLRGLPPATHLAWDPRGLDLAVCGAAGGRFHYLRPGGRDPGDPRPEREACVDPTAPGEEHELASRFVGAHALATSRLLRERVVSDDLVVFPSARPLAPLHFEGRSGALEPHAPEGGVAAVSRNGRVVALEVAGEVHAYAASDGLLLRSERGKLLGACGDRLLVARREPDDQGYTVVDLDADEEIGALRVGPSLLLGPSPSCAAILAQSPRGELFAVSLETGQPTPLGALGGLVHDAAGAHGDAWLAASSGEILRVREDAAGRVRGPEVVARAVPYVTALAPGEQPGELWFADLAGVHRLRGGAVSRVAVPDSHVEWTDLAPLPSGHLLLASSDRLALLDVRRGELVGGLRLPGADRLSPWGGGSFLAWGFERQSPPRGFVLPFDLKRAAAAARAASNLVARGAALELRD